MPSSLVRPKETCPPELFMATDGSASMRCSVCNSDCIVLRETFHAIDATPAALPARQTCDGMASINLDDHPLDCQACPSHAEGSGLPMRCLEMPDTKHSSRANTSALANEETGVNEEPNSDPAFSRNPASPLPNTKKTSIQPKVCHPWLGSLIGLGSLTMAIVSLLMYTIRSYRMAVWTTRNDELQACIGLIQVCDFTPPNIAC